MRSRRTDRRVRPALLERLQVRHLRLLDELSEGGSLSAAANRCGLSQPTATRMMRELEEAFGQPLSTRFATGARLTDSGRLVNDFARNAILQLEQCCETLERTTEADRVTLRIGNCGSYGLTSAIRAFHRLHPNAEVSVMDGAMSPLYAMLDADKLDLVAGPLVNNPTGYKSIALYQLPLAFIVRRGHPLLARDRHDWESLMAYPWLVAREGSPFRHWLDLEAARHNITIPRESIESSSASVNEEMLQDSDIIVALPLHIHLNMIRTGLAVALNLDPAPSLHKFGAVTRNDDGSRAAIDAFIVCLRNAARAPRKSRGSRQSS